MQWDCSLEDLTTSNVTKSVLDKQDGKIRLFIKICRIGCDASCERNDKWKSKGTGILCWSWLSILAVCRVCFRMLVDRVALRVPPTCQLTLGHALKLLIKFVVCCCAARYLKSKSPSFLLFTHSNNKTYLSPPPPSIFSPSRSARNISPHVEVHDVHSGLMFWCGMTIKSEVRVLMCLLHCSSTFLIGKEGKKWNKNRVETTQKSNYGFAALATEAPLPMPVTLVIMS